MVTLLKLNRAEGFSSILS